MTRMRFAKKSRYNKLDDGSFVPEDEPDSAARRLHRHSHSLTYHVREWTMVSNVEGFDQTKERERFTFYRDEPKGIRLRCFLENDRRNLWSLRNGGIEPIGGAFNFHILPIEEKEIEGYIHHCPPSSQGDESDDDPSEENSGTVSGALGIPRERFDWIIENLLKAPGARLTLSLSMKLYKEEIAHAFDDHWMSQDFMLPYDEYTQIEAYEIAVAHGPGLKRLIGNLDEGDGGDSLPVSNEQGLQILTPVASATASPFQRDKRLDYILWLLAALVAITLFR